MLIKQNPYAILNAANAVTLRTRKQCYCIKAFYSENNSLNNNNNNNNNNDKKKKNINVHKKTENATVVKKSARKPHSKWLVKVGSKEPQKN